MVLVPGNFEMPDGDTHVKVFLLIEDIPGIPQGTNCKLTMLSERGEYLFGLSSLRKATSKAVGKYLEVHRLREGDSVQDYRPVSSASH